MFLKLIDDLNFVKSCRRYNIGLWQCPNFLFLVMGAVTIAAMFGTYFVSERSHYSEAVTIASVTLVAVFILVTGSSVVRGVEKIAEANIMKTEFISIISHQLRTPLASIKWNLEIIKDSATGDLSVKQKTFLRNVEKANEEMLKLVSSLVEVVRIDQGKAVFRKENVKPSLLIEEVISDLQTLALSRKIKIVTKISKKLPLIYVDPKRMKVVVHNLISNAIKYSYEGGKIEVHLGRGGSGVLFKVRDWGVGIPEHQQNRVFEKFFRSENNLKYRTDGIGLGLYLAKAILRSFGGKVWFESEVNKGSTFYFSLPTANQSSKLRLKA